MHPQNFSRVPCSIGSNPVCSNVHLTVNVLGTFLFPLTVILKVVSCSKICKLRVFLWLNNFINIPLFWTSFSCCDFLYAVFPELFFHVLNSKFFFCSSEVCFLSSKVSVEVTSRSLQYSKADFHYFLPLMLYLLRCCPTIIYLLNDVMPIYWIQQTRNSVVI